MTETSASELSSPASPYPAISAPRGHNPHHPALRDSVRALCRTDSEKQMAEMLFNGGVLDDMQHYTAQKLHDFSQMLYQTMQQRRTGESLVATYPDGQHRILVMCNDDMPFLVDSTVACLQNLGINIDLLSHPVCHVHRDSTGNLIGFAPESSSAVASDTRNDTVLAESCILIITADDGTPSENLVQTLQSVFADVRSAVHDWRNMRQKARDTILDLSLYAPQNAETAEIKNLMEWLEGGQYVFLGYRDITTTRQEGTFRLAPVPDSGLGILRDATVKLFDGLATAENMPASLDAILDGSTKILFLKSSHRSTVHRRAFMDCLALPLFDSHGKITGVRLFAGLLSSAAYAKSAREIPYLRAKVTRVLTRANFNAHSHNGKALAHVLDNWPRDDLFQIDDDSLYHGARSVMHLSETPRIALLMRRDAFMRYASCMIYLPRDRLDTAFRRKAASLLAKAWHGELSSEYIQMDDAPLARLHLILKTDPADTHWPDVTLLEAHLTEIARGWPETLTSALQLLPAPVANSLPASILTKRYEHAFQTSWHQDRSPPQIAQDIHLVESALASESIALSLTPIDGEPTKFLFHLVTHGHALALADLLPILENLGLRPLQEAATKITPADHHLLWLHEVTVESRLPAAHHATLFCDAFRAVWLGQAENDGFNRLALSAGLDWKRIAVLRAYARYMRQARLPYSQLAIESTLNRWPDITRTISEYFLHRFDATLATDRTENCGRIEAAILGALDSVSSLEEDRILRALLGLIRATLRTNFFQTNPDGSVKTTISFKLDSQSITELPLPRPFVEIFVCSPRMEGIHLRGGKIARGGIRWSDRREDFRSEILDLMKAQMVKNAVIVPVGSKGGFVLKHPPSSNDRAAFQAEGIACYQILVRGMLDITDNIVDGVIVPPPNVVRHDGDDPYLVVAADKGTASFSDIANALSHEYGFWLDDAFASGGSVGYDHKKMAITARGAWEAVKRHFRELGLDTQLEDFTVIGVGDMAGDVFGNGMLLSRHIRLLGAFNHKHIFCDPNPDSKKSFAERQRLFDLPGSQWSDYDSAMLSTGGRIYDRNTKSCDLTPEIQSLFGLKDSSVTPNELIRAMLQASVDLLYFGGIGNFVKSSAETHEQVIDKANDAVRINGNQIRARVVTEGANLGMTHQGRIEYAQSGGRINTDFIDNSGGVDCSDHEVNIKILLKQIESDGGMTRAQRNLLLTEMTDDVAALVLADNYYQTQALSIMLSDAPKRLDRHAHVLRELERAGRLDRVVEDLPDDIDINRRLLNGEGLTRPELAKLMSYAKIVLFEEILATDLPDDPAMLPWLKSYFPTAIQSRFDSQIQQHRLKREIVATVLANAIINRVGIGFLRGLVDATGADFAATVRAFVIVASVFNLGTLWEAIESLDGAIRTDLQIRLFDETTRKLYRAMSWFLTRRPQPLDIGTEIERHQEPIQSLAGHLPEVLDANELAVLKHRIDSFMNDAIPADLSRNLAVLPWLAAGLDVIAVAADSKHRLVDAAEIYFATGDRLDLNWLRQAAGTLTIDDLWQRQARDAIISEVYDCQRSISLHIATAGLELDDWLAQQPAYSRFTHLMTNLKEQKNFSTAMLTLATQRLRLLAA